jgi:formylglycine-generating enzyme required for sulfatase activity
MVLIRGGAFWMGNPPERLRRFRDPCQRIPVRRLRKDGHYEMDELPRRRVTLDAFCIERVAVTNALSGSPVTARGRRAQFPVQRRGRVWGGANKGVQLARVGDAY